MMGTQSTAIHVLARLEQPDVAAALDQLPNADVLGARVCAGDLIEADVEEGFLRGHGTQPAADALRATQCGTVSRINRLVSVRPLRQRYSAEMGDVVVGRVIEAAQRRWTIDLRSRQDVSLLLSAVNLPGNVQRRRNAEDELNMRKVYGEDDLLSAEVQSVHNDGSVSLQTRGTKYGKLENGQLIVVPSILVPRQKQHFTGIEGTGVSLVLGVNGLIWVGWDALRLPEQEVVSTRQAHERIARAANVIRALAKLSFAITPVRIASVYKQIAGLQASAGVGIEVHLMQHERFLLTVCALEEKHRLERR